MAGECYLLDLFNTEPDTWAFEAIHAYGSHEGVFLQYFAAKSRGSYPPKS